LPNVSPKRPAIVPRLLMRVWQVKLVPTAKGGPKIEVAHLALPSISAQPASASTPMTQGPI